MEGVSHLLQRRRKFGTRVVCTDEHGAFWSFAREQTHREPAA